MKATREQIHELANTVARQLAALANQAAFGFGTEQELFAKAKLVEENAATLTEWTRPN